MVCLYKFIADPEVVRFFLEGKIKFTPTRELNDPSELVPQMTDSEVIESLTRFRRNGYSAEDFGHLRRQGALLKKLAPHRQVVDPQTREEATAMIQSSFYDSVKTLRRLLDETARDISSGVGLFCLSRRYDSLPMWAHYAANASGLAIELKGLERVFSGDDTGILRQLMPVQYARERFGVTFDPTSHRHLFFTKYEDWQYEKEVRVVMPLAECRAHVTDASVSYLYDIPRSCVSRILLGWNVSKERALAVQAHVRMLNPEVDIVRAGFRGGHIDLVSMNVD